VFLHSVLDYVFNMDCCWLETRVLEGAFSPLSSSSLTPLSEGEFVAGVGPGLLLSSSSSMNGQSNALRVGSVVVGSSKSCLLSRKKRSVLGCMCRASSTLFSASDARRSREQQIIFWVSSVRTLHASPCPTFQAKPTIRPRRRDNFLLPICP